MSPNNAVQMVIRLALLATLISTTSLVAQEESRWDPAFERMTPLVDLQGQMIMTDPCFYYLSYGSEWTTGAIWESTETALNKSSDRTPNYRDLRLHDETLQSCHYWAQRGKISHQYGLGLLYLNGDQVDQDYARAFYWLALASQSGHRLAPQYRDEAKNKLTARQRSKVIGAVQEFKPLEN